MLRLKILVSAVPLIAAALLARVEFFPATQPCLAIGANTLQIASAPWHADLHVSFTDDPRLATVRVAISDSAETADFAVVDDVDGTEETACEPTAATRFVAIPPDALSGFTVLGELGLDGSIAPVAGVLPAAIGANSRDEGLICAAAWARKRPGRAPTSRSSPPTR